MYKHRNLGTKSQELLNLKFSGRLFVSESMSLENQQLAYKYQQLKSARKIHFTWFFNNVVNVKLAEHGRINKIFHVTDVEKLLETIWRSTLIMLLFNLMNQSNNKMT